MTGTLDEGNATEEFLSGPGPKNKVAPYVVLSLNAHRYAVDAMSVLKVVVKPSIARVPGHPAHVLGLAQVSDRLIPVLDLAVLAKSPGTPVQVQTLPRLVVIGDSVRSVGIIADETHGIEELPHREGDNTELIIATIEIDDRPVSYLAIDKLMALAASEDRSRELA